MDPPSQPSSFRSTDDMRTYLRQLHSTLKRMGQVEQDADGDKRARIRRLSDLTPVCRTIIAKKFVGHRSQEVRVLVVCCLVDILRVCAPDTPFGERDLETVFKLVNRTIRDGLVTSMDGTTYKRTVHMLKVLSSFHIVCCALDIDDGHVVLHDFFASCFETCLLYTSPSPRDS